MTGIRQSIVFAKEETFKGGKPVSNVWVQPPPNSYFSSTPSQAVTRLQSMGTKFADGFAYGAFSGIWEWSFMLDYHYLEPLTFVFESYAHSSIAGGSFEHVFVKDSAQKIPSFTIRQKVLNQMAGGPTGSDVVRVLVGCVCTDFSMARSASTSQYQVTMSGFYADESIQKGVLLSTDYKAYSPELVEYSCLSVGDSTIDVPEPTLANCEYVANTMSVSLGVKNNAEAIYGLCTSKPTQYAEGVSDFTFATTCYSNDPSRYQQRMYSGGYDKEALAPKSKGRKPLYKIHVTSFSNELGNNTIATAYNSSAYGMDIELTDMPIKSIPWVKGDGSKLQDSISGSECIGFKMTIHTTESSFDTTAYTSNSPHAVTSPNPAQAYPVASFNANTGSGTAMGSITGPYIVLPACTYTKTGYSCTSWLEGDASTGAIRDVGSTCNIMTDTVFYAKWTLVQYGIVYHENGGAFVEGHDIPETYTYAAATVLPTGSDITKTDYTFDGWYDNEELTGSAITQIASGQTGAKEFWAKWTESS